MSPHCYALVTLVVWKRIQNCHHSDFNAVQEFEGSIIWNWNPAVVVRSLWMRTSFTSHRLSVLGEYRAQYAAPKRRFKWMT